MKIMDLKDCGYIKRAQKKTAHASGLFYFVFDVNY
jgi:hypothetical protein